MNISEFDLDKILLVLQIIENRRKPSERIYTYETYMIMLSDIDSAVRLAEATRNSCHIAGVITNWS
jgi:DUF1365 family protein